MSRLELSFLSSFVVDGLRSWWGHGMLRRRGCNGCDAMYEFVELLVGLMACRMAREDAILPLVRELRKRRVMHGNRIWFGTRCGFGSCQHKCACSRVRSFSRANERVATVNSGELYLSVCQRPASEKRASALLCSALPCSSELVPVLRDRGRTRKRSKRGKGDLETRKKKRNQEKIQDCRNPSVCAPSRCVAERQADWIFVAWLGMLSIMGGSSDFEFIPVERMSTSETSDAKYRYVIVRAPRLAGFPLRCFVWMLESGLTASALKSKLKRDNLITRFFSTAKYEEPPMYISQYPEESVRLDQNEAGFVQVLHSTPPVERVKAALTCLPSVRVQRHDGFRHWTIRDYAEAYQNGTATPTVVAERFLSALEESYKQDPPMSFFINYDEKDILRQAEESTARYLKGEPLSILDGVPIAVKDEIDCLPYPTTGGTKWLHKVRKTKDDAACIKRLRECGAVLVGKTNMHELGMGTTSINPHYGTPRNPYGKDRISGGSSGGSAAAVASGLVPVALGVDGGGSVRMPAGLCGVVGMKATFGRTSNAGIIPLNWTVGMLGTLTATVEDALIMYAAVLGHLPQDRIVSIPPPAAFPISLDLPKTEASKLVGELRIAKYTEWFDDSDDNVKDGCYRALELLQQAYGNKIIEVTVPEIEEMRLAHFITIGSECLASLGSDYEHVGMEVSGADVRVGFAIYKAFNNMDFIAAQRMRYRQMHYFMDIFQRADVIVTPITGCTAPPLTNDSLKYGELNYITGAKLMRFQIAGNFLGLPALSVPVGHDEDGLPIGLQIIGRPWAEATVLQLAAAIEDLCAPMRKRPEVLYDLLI